VRGVLVEALGMSRAVAILAGGLATRLRPLSASLPKALIDVAGKPFIVHQIEALRRQNMSRIVVCAAYLGETIQQALGDGHDLNVTIEYAFDGPVRLGTAGALKRALPLLGDSFFVLYGDSYLRVDYAKMATAFDGSGKLAMMSVYRNQGKWDTSNVVFAHGMVRSHDKQHPAPDAQHIDYGLSIMRKAALAGVPANRRADLADVFRSLAREGELAGFEVFERFYEIGSRAGLEETRAYLSKSSESSS
jgi:N-acetyl-alpha-D-muramate 1-phosphate uridylyltransferase